MLTSCIVDGRSTVFFIDKNGWLKIKVNPNASDIEPNGATVGRKAWAEDFLQLKGQNVKSLSHDMAAVSYPLAGNPPVTRVSLHC
jgi:hypothetical protein